MILQRTCSHGIIEPRKDGLLIPVKFVPITSAMTNSSWTLQQLQTNKYAAQDLLDIQNACSTYKDSGTDPNWLMSVLKALLKSISS